jgi:23S rRNA (cytosine1962-C5)-methyltransferase
VASGEYADACIFGIGKVRRDVKLLGQYGAGADHPVHPQLPESAYLKGLLFQLG